MFLNVFLVFIILGEILGFSSVQEKILSNREKQGIEEQGLKEQTLGAKSLPQIGLEEIAPLPVSNSSDSTQSIETRAPAAAILDLKTNKILYQKNSQKDFSIASITKLMSAVVLFENFDLKETVTVSPKSAYILGSKMHLYSGEQIRAEELVKGMLIVSANDAAKALEEHYGKDKVVEKMNQKAAFLNLKESHFVEVSGLDSGNKSSARDLIILTRYALENSKIAELVKTKEYTVVSTDGKLQHLIHTTNRLLKNYPDIFGVKTGYTEEAGNCLIAGAENSGHRIISVVLGVDNYDLRFSESRALLDWAFNNYNW